MDAALKALFYGLEGYDALTPGRLLFVNASAHADIPSGARCVQWFYPYADALKHQGFEVSRRIEDVDGAFDTILMLAPKNMDETRYLLAKSIGFLAKGARIFVCAENDAGGKRLQKILQQFGGEIVQQISKYKARCVEAVFDAKNTEEIDKAVAAGSLKNHDGIGFSTQAGIYGWDKIDAGSALLLQHLPRDMTGRVADFGCGYGCLLQHFLQQNLGIKQAFAIDADARALDCARENLKDYDGVEYFWADLTVPQNLPPLDIIIMNPPFHVGKKADSAIGTAFIHTAAASLKSGGALYMVANTHLPYEALLNDVFSQFDTLTTTNGFKVFKAVL